MACVRPFCAVCGLLGWSLVSAPIFAQNRLESSPSLVSVSARSVYPGLDRGPHEAAIPTGSPIADPPAPAGYLQYEPQNVPLATDPPSLLHEIPPLTDLPTEPPPQRLPPIVPYSTQFQFTYNAGSGDDLGITNFDIREVFVFPRISGFMITPGFATQILNGPASTDLPGTLYENWVEFRWLKKFDDRWTADFAITPGLYSDYENLTSDAVRIQGRAVALFSYRPDMQVAFGFLYLDREDIAAMLVAGFIWSPNDDYKLELVFPRPRFMKRISGDDECSRWAYVGGEFGGGSWGIQRPATVALPERNDIVTYSVLRFLVGVETKKPKGFAPRVEAGFSFGRRIEYKSGVGDFDPSPVATIRFGGSF